MQRRIAAIKLPEVKRPDQHLGACLLNPRRDGI